MNSFFIHSSILFNQFIYLIESEIRKQQGYTFIVYYNKNYLFLKLIQHQLSKYKMMHDPNIGQGMQKQFIKAIDLYHRPVPNDGKHKNSHGVSRLYQGVSVAQTDKKNNNHAQMSKLSGFLSKIQVNITKQYEKVSMEMNQLKKRIIMYYFQFKKIIDKHEGQLLLQIQHNQKINKQVLHQHVEKIRKKKSEIEKQNLKKSFQQQKMDLKQLAVIQVPVYRIEGSSFKSFQKILEQLLQQFKPLLINGKMSKSNESKKQKQNEPPHQFTDSISHSQILVNQKKSSQKKEQNESTIKKQSNPSASPGYIHQFNPICEFSCDQKLEWNPNQVRDLNNHFSMHYNGNRFDKKQITSQVIVEQPSSCEDSIMISDVS